MKKKSWLVLYYLGVSAVLLLLMYSYAKGLTMFTIFLGIPTLAVVMIEARFERQFLRENPEIKKDKTYQIAKTLGYICTIILVVGVWWIRFK